MTVRILCGDALERLRELPDESAHTVVTSPPYWGLRDYGVAGQIGLEQTVGEYVETLVSVFREVRRVLRPDGTLWLNLGDTYNNADKWGGGGANTGKHTRKPNGEIASWEAVRRRWSHCGLKPKDLVGVPWRVAFALQADGWYLRQDIIWAKPNPMPESVRDRCTKAHEYLFLLSKSERYYFDQEAILEPAAPASVERLSQPTLDQQQGSVRVPGKLNGPMKAVCRAPHGRTDADYARMNARQDGLHGKIGRTAGERRTKAGLMAVADKPWIRRNRRSVWTVTTQPFSEAHFATFPPALIEPCILAGCPVGGTVLDPFGGSGTTGLVANRLDRDAVLIELNPEYAEMAERRLRADAPLFAEIAAE